MFNFLNRLSFKRVWQWFRKILLDLQELFDTIDHEILLQKFKELRFSENMELLKSYLSERVFIVNIGNKLSDFEKSSCRVPQRSVSGPLLFFYICYQYAISSSINFSFICWQFVYPISTYARHANWKNESRV